MLHDGCACSGSFAGAVGKDWVRFIDNIGSGMDVGGRVRLFMRMTLRTWALSGSTLSSCRGCLSLADSHVRGVYFFVGTLIVVPTVVVLKSKTGKDRLS